MTKTIGCLGCGNMGSALLAGFVHTLDKNGWRLTGFDPDAAKCQRLAALGVEIAKNAEQVAHDSDIILLAVKPAILPAVISDIAGQTGEGKAVISIAAGIGLASLRNQLGPKCQIARCMPTTTARAGHGIFAICFDPLSQSEAFQDEILNLFGKIGICLKLAENRFPDFSALIGAGPAYVFQMMLGLDLAALNLGFSQKQGRELLVELFAGCAALAAQEKDKNFAQLRDDVCSPAGLTLAGINVLERAGINGLLTDAALAAKNRAKEMEN